MKISTAPVPPSTIAPSRISAGVTSPRALVNEPIPLGPPRDLATAEIRFETNFGGLGVVALSTGKKTLASHAALDDALIAARRLSAGKRGAVAVVEWTHPSPWNDKPPAFVLVRVEIPNVQTLDDDPSVVPTTSFHPEQSWPSDGGPLRPTLSIHGRPPTVLSSVAAIVDGRWKWTPLWGISQPARTSSASALPA